MQKVKDTSQIISSLGKGPNNRFRFQGKYHVVVRLNGTGRKLIHLRENENLKLTFVKDALFFIRCTKSQRLYTLFRWYKNIKQLFNFSFIDTNHRFRQYIKMFWVYWRTFSAAYPSFHWFSCYQYSSFSGKLYVSLWQKQKKKREWKITCTSTLRNGLFVNFIGNDRLLHYRPIIFWSCFWRFLKTNTFLGKKCNPYPQENYQRNSNCIKTQTGQVHDKHWPTKNSFLYAYITFPKQS